MENPIPLVFMVHPPFVYPCHRRLLYRPPPRILRQKQIEEELQQLIVNLHIQTQTQTQTHKPYNNTMLPEKFIWKFPWHNFLKLNTDGSSKGNPGPSSFGGLIRDNQGRWLCGYTGKMNGGSYTALQAEVWAILKGLCLIKEKNLSFLIIETDCLAAVQLTVRELKKDHPMKRIIEDIKRLMREQKCMIIHTKRDGNHCADQLAKLGGKQSEECMVLLEDPPEFLLPFMLRDIEAATNDQFQNNHMITRH